MPHWSAAQRLKLNISAEEIARVGRTRGSRPTRAGRLRKHATSKIRLVVRRRHGEIRITANPVMREKCPRLGREVKCAARFVGAGLSVLGEERDGQDGRER